MIAVATACLRPGAARADVTGSLTATPQQAALATLLLGPSSPGLQSLPGDAAGALAQAIDAVATDLGVSTDASAAVAAAQLPAAVTARLAVVLQDMHACDAVTAAALQQLQPTVVSPEGDAMPSIPETSVVAIQLCAATLYTDGLALQDYVRTSTANGTMAQSDNVLDVWPVVRYDTTGAGHEYDYDYALTVATGNNQFYNNAGSNVIDPFHGAVDGQPARGCELVSEILGAAVPRCVLASSLLIQVGGDHNVFGRMQSPDADAFMPGSNPPVPCTTGNLVRRLFTEGAAVAGVGILMNTSTGRNLYLGKVGTQGTGHIGGVGLLDISGGNNVFSAIRNAQGFGFIDGLGILHSKDASNRFTWYMPAASAPGDASTTGTGIVDDAGNCEGRPRHLQGSGELGGTGVLYAVNSNGVYQSDTVLGQGSGDVIPPGTPQPNLGGPGAAGILISRGSVSSRYTGVPGRAEDTVVVGVRATDQPAVTATDLFDDDVFPFAGGRPCGSDCSPTAQDVTALAIDAMGAS